MKKTLLISALAVVISAMTACTDDNFVKDSSSEGRLILTPRVNADIKASRAISDADSLNEKLVVWLTKVGKGVVRKFNGLDEIPSSIYLIEGDYLAEGWTGDSVPASFDKRYFKGVEPFSIKKDDVKAVELTCKMANVVAAVKYGENVKTVVSDYSMTIEHSRGALVFEGDESRDGYFMMPTDDEGKSETTLKWTLTGKLENGSTYTRKGTIEGVKPATRYTLSVKYTEQSDELGGGYLDIVVDETVEEKTETIELVMPPEILGFHFNIGDKQYINPDDLDRLSVFVKTTSDMKSVSLKSDAFTSVLGLNEFDLVRAGGDVLEAVKTKGIKFVKNYDAVTGNADMKISFEIEFLEALGTGDYEIEIAVSDVNGKSSKAILSMSISKKPLIVDSSDSGVNAPGMIAYPDKTVLKAVVALSDDTGYGFKYREAAASRADGDWTFVAGTIVEENGKNMLTATLADLKPDTRYEYKACTDSYESPEVCSFTTEAAVTAELPQLPNSGFEGWSKPEKPYLIYGEGEEMFWDSGNHGSATMNKNVTEPDGTVKHSGNYSAKLSSQFVGVGSIGKFAAGNVFIGKFLGTEGTDGILGWGRPFTARPKALRAWVKYTPGTVSYENSGFTDLRKGDSDEGIIYISLLSNEEIKEYNGEKWPVIIKTKTKELFNKNGKNVVAYGELVFKEATGGADMVMVEIPLDYHTLNVRPSYITVTCAASRGGDYFVGGNSTMWVDDIELVYE